MLFLSDRRHIRDGNGFSLELVVGIWKKQRFENDQRCEICFFQRFENDQKLFITLKSRCASDSLGLGISYLSCFYYARAWIWIWICENWDMFKNESDDIIIGKLVTNTV